MRERLSSITSVFSPGMISTCSSPSARVLDVIDFFVDVTLHAAAERRVKLSYVANLQT